MAEILRIASEISTPIGLAGFAFAALFLIIHQLIKANKIPRLTGGGSLKLIDRMFILAVIAMALGFIGSVYAKPKNLVYRGAVLDAVTGDTIEEASIVILGHPEFYPATTDAHGSFTLSTASYETAHRSDATSEAREVQDLERKSANHRASRRGHHSTLTRGATKASTDKHDNAGWRSGIRNSMGQGRRLWRAVCRNVRAASD